jgi:hypothetical protein
LVCEDEVLEGDNESFRKDRKGYQQNNFDLTGNAGSRAERLLAEKIAQSVEGIRKVVNNLGAPEEIQP